MIRPTGLNSATPYATASTVERWTLLWTLGSISLLVGALLLFFPIVPSASHNVSPPNLASEDQWYFYEVNVTTFSVTGSVPFALYWSSTSPLYLDYATCQHPQSNFSELFRGNSSQNGCSEVYGVSGSSNNPALTASIPAGGSIILGWGIVQYGSPPISISFTTWTGLTLAPPVLLIGGAAAVIVGVALWKRDENLTEKLIRQDSQQYPETKRLD